MEESPVKELNEIEASNLSDIEFKKMIIRMLKELSEKYKELNGTYSNMKKVIETMNNNEKEMKNTISEIEKNIYQKELKAGYVNQRTESVSWKTR